MKRTQPLSREWRRTHRLDLRLAAGLVVAWAVSMALALTLAA